MINIDNNDYFEMFQFPGGEYGVKRKKFWEPDIINIFARINSGNDLIKLLTFTDAIRRMKIHIRCVHIPYFPGARQDRVNYIGEPLTSKVYADVINSQKYDEVLITDPHSDVVPSLVNNCSVQQVSGIIRSIVNQYEYDTILIPDAGATKRMFSYYFPDVEINVRFNFVQCLKKRDTQTGKLSGFQVIGPIAEKKCLIVDDICDGGGTFIGLAKELSNKSAPFLKPKKLGLYVTHGIFSRGVDELKLWFDDIHTTDSIRDKQPDGINIFTV